LLYRSLGKTGLRVSVLGYGAAPLGGVYGHVDEATGIATVRRALDLGVNLIDVAPYYGATAAETLLGKGLEGVDRSSYVLATKVGRYGLMDFDFSAARVVASVDESLRRLGTDYVDIIQCHDIEFVDVSTIIDETIPVLQQLKDEGKVRFVGVTGYPLAPLARVCAALDIDTVLSYCRFNLLDTALRERLPYFAEHNVGVISASPLAMGLLTPAGPPPWHPARADIVAATQRAAKYCVENGLELAKLALQFAISNADVASTLVGAAAPEVVEQNVEWAAEMPDIRAIAAVQQILSSVTDPTWASGRPENSDSPGVPSLTKGT
jgi:L-galactose dehydrogenase